MPIDCEGLIESLPPEVMSTDIVIEQASDITFGDIGFLIRSGKCLLKDSKIYKHNLHGTQTFSQGDSIGFAEVISRRNVEHRYGILEPLTVSPYAGDRLRKEIAGASFLLREVIRYSLRRIFEADRGGPSAVFEDKFFRHHAKLAQRLSIPNGSYLYQIGDESRYFYLIEKGKVALQNEVGATFATISDPECLGEISVIEGRNRTSTALALTDVTVLALNSAVFCEEIAKDSPLSQICLIQVLRRLHLMNQLRYSHM